jgi:phospholipase C
MIRKSLALTLSSLLILSGCGQGTLSNPAGNGNANTTPPPTPPTPTTSASVIKHIVVIYGENVSFDHYFGTYPQASNPAGETPFTAATAASAAASTTALPATPTNIANYISTPSLLTANPNLNAANTVTAMNSTSANPFRLDPAQAGTNDQDHNYGPEQMAFDGGKMDLFPLSVGTANPVSLTTATNGSALLSTTALTMGYYDGNTVTAMWNYAQHYAMNDHSFGSTFGPSTPGALELASGQTNGVANFTQGAASGVIADGAGGYTDIGDEDPAGDLCSSTSANMSMSGKNIGDLLNAANITWGFFEGGFNLAATNANGTTGCARTTAAVNIPGNPLKADYIPHHEPFQYYASTANPNHLRPTAAIGTTDQANHQYDTTDFTASLAAGTMPAVSFLKAPGFQDAHAGYSDPLDEQTFVVNTINAIEKSQFWSSTAIIIAYDDSDGWYDHMTDFVNGSATTADSLTGTGACAPSAAPAATLPGPNSNGAPVQGRCGHGPRLPLLVISSWAKKNFIDNTPTDQASIPRFIEDTFLGSTRIGGGSFDATAGTLDNMFNFANGATVPNPNVVQLNPSTGVVTSSN